MRTIEVMETESLFRTLKNRPELSVGDVAFGLWLQGDHVNGVHLMGRTCIEDPVNSKHLNNMPLC